MNDKTAKPGELLSRFPEINFNNYGQQEVEALQAWAFEAFDAMSATLLKLAESDYAYDSSMAEIKRLVRDLDVLLNGENGAAKQASLCDIVGQVASVVREQDAPLLSAPPAAGVPEAVHVLRSAYEGHSAGLFNSGAPKHLWSAAMLELFESLDEEVQEEARETVMAHSDMRAVAAIDSVIALLTAPTPPASEQQRAVVMPERKPYPDPDGCPSNPEWWARKHEEAKGWNACLDEFLRLNPHLAKGEASEKQAVVTPKLSGTAIVEVVKGVEGPSLYIGNDSTGYRLAGPKPWGGGKTIHKFTVKLDELVREAMDLAAPSQGGE